VTPARRAGKVFAPMATTALRSLLDARCLAAVGALLEDVRRDRARLPVVFPGMPRTLGRAPAGTGVREVSGARIDLAAFRVCDLAAAVLLLEAEADAAAWFDLYAHGDIEERAMLLRSLHLAPLGPTTVRLLGEIQRTNIVLHLEAALCDGDLFARAVAAGTIDRTVANKLLLKLAFLDLPLRRALGAEATANESLSTMLVDLATEREAAGRAVWRDTWRMIGRAPCPGAAARLVGGLEHGDDGVRLAAAEGLLSLCRPDLIPFAVERLPREPVAAVRDVLLRLTSPNHELPLRRC
jgi:hypothetical protein